MPESAIVILEAVERAWAPLREAVTRLEPDALEATTSGGWTAKEMLAHIAFWDEAVMGVVVGMFRDEPLPHAWRFGSGYLPADGEGWPPTDVHNAREAAWARGRSAAEVITRLDAAHEQMVAVLSTVTDDEAHTHAEYFGSLPAHYLEHRPELDGVYGN